MDLEQGVAYRMAYGLAFRLFDAHVCRGSGRWRSNPAAGGDTSAITAEVIRQLAVNDQVGRELAREACEDACSGRQPRW
jgi:hypothetical protein